MISLKLDFFENEVVVLSFTSNFQDEGIILSPKDVVLMLEKISRQKISLLKIHRQILLLTWYIGCNTLQGYLF